MAKKVKFRSNLSKVISTFEKGAEAKLITAANIGRASVVEVLTGTRGGREYKVPGTQVRVKASAPGEAPATRTGRLRQSYAVSDIYDHNGNMSIRVGSELDYARRLERGTKKMKPRPHLEPAMRKVQPQINIVMEEPWF